MTLNLAKPAHSLLSPPWAGRLGGRHKEGGRYGPWRAGLWVSQAPVWKGCSQRANREGGEKQNDPQVISYCQALLTGLSLTGCGKTSFREMKRLAHLYMLRKWLSFWLLSYLAVGPWNMPELGFFLSLLCEFVHFPVPVSLYVFPWTEVFLRLRLPIWGGSSLGHQLESYCPQGSFSLPKDSPFHLHKLKLWEALLRSIHRGLLPAISGFTPVSVLRNYS